MRQKPDERLPLGMILLFGPLALFFGGLVFASMFGILPPQPSAAMPRSVMALAGLVFSSAGVAVLLSRVSRTLARLFGTISFLCFVAIFNWIAFGPGERHFTQTTSVGSIKSSEPASEGSGRLVFGLFAGGLDLLLGYGLIASLGKSLRKGR